MSTDLETLKRRLRDVATTGRGIELRPEHASALLDALAPVPGLAMDHAAWKAELADWKAAVEDRDRDIRQWHQRAKVAERSLREMTSSYHTVCVQVAAFEEAAEKVAHAPRAGRDIAIGVLRRVLEGYIGTRISVEEDELDLLRRVEAAAEACVQYWEGEDGYEYAEPEAALRLLMRPALVADRAALAPTSEGSREECPRCGSPKPEMHPAVQADGGEVSPCSHPFHASTPAGARALAKLPPGVLAPASGEEGEG